MKRFILVVAYFLFEIAVGVIIDIAFGKDNRKSLEKLIESLSEEDLTPTQKYNRAKKFLDSISDDVPDTAKNLAIEAIVGRITGKRVTIVGDKKSSK